MPEFRQPAYTPMDREYHERINVEPVHEKPDIEAPIIPINEIGETFPETDQSGRFKTFIQHAQAAIRTGAGNLQLVMTVPHTSPIGGRFKSYGKEVREALREVAMANQVKISGVELPTSSMTNMSGYDPQRNRFSDEVRKDHLDEVRDAIKFVAEAMGGGGVDIVSWEYERPINDATWNDPGKKTEQKMFRQPGEIEVVQVVDTKTGGVVGLRKGEAQHLSYKIPTEPDDVTFNGTTGRWELKEIKAFKEGGLPELKKWQWEDFERAAELINKKAKEEGKPGIKPETLLIQMQLEGQLKTAQGYAGHYGVQAEREGKIVKVLAPIMEKFETLSDEQKKQKLDQGLAEQKLDFDPDMAVALNKAIKNKDKLEAIYKKYDTDYQHLRSLAEGQMQQVEEIQERQKRFKAVSDYAVQKAVESYAEAGIWAEQETHNKLVYEKNPIHVGPEIGWPQFYGSHPQEFVDLIMKSREEMVRRLTTNDNSNFKPGLSKSQAEEQARTHIKGVFDTGHLGMWLRNFRPELPWDDRVKKFNEWFTGQVKWMAEINKKEDIIGAIQVVDTATGAHAHLPAGQGILPIVDAVKILKNNGFHGFIVSEGHEEEKFGEGRILLKTWENFGSRLTSNPYRPAGSGPMRWNEVQNSYFGKTYSPMFMFGAYAPSNEFKLWSEIPLE